MVFGIDIGRTIRVAKMGNDGKPVSVYFDSLGADYLLSSIYFEDANNIFYGEDAEILMVDSPEKGVRFSKMMLETEDSLIEVDGHTYPPYMILALLLRRIKDLIEQQPGMKMTDVVITCPEYLGYIEKSRIREAGLLAGLNVIGLISDGSAAILGTCYPNLPSEEVFLVYDLGDTFKVSVIKCEKDGFTTICTAGDSSCDIDSLKQYLYQMLIDRLEAEGVDISSLTSITTSEIRLSVEKIIVQLSERRFVQGRIGIGNEKYSYVISKDEFEEATYAFAEQTLDTVERALDTAHMRKGIDNVDIILIVGGASQMPIIRETVQARFPGKVIVADPVRAMAKGAVILGVSDRRTVCANCRHDYISGDKYCRFCGAPMGTPDYIERDFACIYGPPPMKRVHTCAKCGFSWETKEMIDSQKWCPKCGGSAPGIESDDSE